MRKPSPATMVLVAAGTLLLASSSRVRIVRVSALKGKAVEIRQKATPGVSRTWTPALLDQSVVEGDGLQTQANSAVEVQLECGSAVRLTPASAVSFTELARSGKGVPMTRVSVQAGRIFFSLRNADTHDLRVEMPGGAVTQANGNARFTVAVGKGAEAGHVRVTVRGGTAMVHARDHAYALKKSEQMSWTPQGAVHRGLAGKATDQWARWSQSRDNMFTMALTNRRLPPFYRRSMPPIARDAAPVPACAAADLTDVKNGPN